MTHNFVLRQLKLTRASPDWRVTRQTRFNHAKNALLHRLHAVPILLVPDRRPGALVSILTLFYSLGDIGVIAGHFRQNFLEAQVFHACTSTFTRKSQRVARRSPRTVSPQKHCTQGARFFTFRVPPLELQTEIGLLCFFHAFGLVAPL